MSRAVRCAALALLALLVVTAQSTVTEAQRRAVPRHPTHPQRPVAVRGPVFIGGYFYDPIHGPYPWWPRTAYPYWYFPIYDNRAEVRITVLPEEAEVAAVYVDGFYAGQVEDFDGVFQGLPLTPGGHGVVLYLEGYRTVRRNFYLSPGGRFRLRATMERLPAGERSEPPELAPVVPAPPPGSYRTPPTRPGQAVPQTSVRPPERLGWGTLDIFVQPSSAEVAIDGQRWISSEEGHFVLQVPAGRHRVEISRAGFRSFATEIAVGDGEVVPLNVSLMAASS